MWNLNCCQNSGFEIDLNSYCNSVALGCMASGYSCHHCWVADTWVFYLLPPLAPSILFSLYGYFCPWYMWTQSVKHYPFIGNIPCTMTRGSSHGWWPCYCPCCSLVTGRYSLGATICGISQALHLNLSCGRCVNFSEGRKKLNSETLFFSSFF